MKHTIRPGWWYPHGATVAPDGVNFSIATGYATSVELLLFERADSPETYEVIQLDPDIHRTFFFWHVFVEKLPAGIHYAWRIDGPDDTRTTGFRFDEKKVLLDPYARAVTHTLWNRKRASQQGDNSECSMRCVIPPDDDYDWERDKTVNHPSQTMVIYEMHVGGFTKHPSSHATYPGTFSGITEKIPYLKALGITHIELMPVMAFDEQAVPENVANLGLKNYWGYNTHSFFSPHPGYCISPEYGTHRREFRDMVKSLHNADIGVILDVVFNHTAEGGAEGPTINFKGLGNDVAYHLDPDDRSIYRDYTCCGNTLNCNHPLVCRFLIDCLEYWVREMHVDGFRFDLASVLIRGEDGNPVEHAPAAWNIELSDVLVHAYIIAEAWDAAGLYQVGKFPGFRWKEWNGRYRDVIRRFVCGEKGLIGEVATRIGGSSDFYEHEGRLPTNSINFITCHDGFTLYDLVSYDEKHNDANGENNLDGMNDNLSWNCGFEGETNNPAILSFRKQQVKNFMAILFLSQGIPMMLSGDEVLRTQQGNNNCYCQDNEMSWFDWALVEENRDMMRFVSELITFRKRHPSLMRKRFLTGEKKKGDRLPDIVWHGITLNEPPWNDPEARILAFTLSATGDSEEDLHIILNMSDDAMEMPLPQFQGCTWYKVMDTSLPSPEDIVKPEHQLQVTMPAHSSAPHSIVVFEKKSFIQEESIPCLTK
ncbi:MAG: glycogen debranching protein GlgX [Proteobacteria bacterium]|nr:glycogen debranching protein GlgX [Pseudomonadota bacterium]